MVGAAEISLTRRERPTSNAAGTATTSIEERTQEQQADQRFDQRVARRRSASRTGGTRPAGRASSRSGCCRCGAIAEQHRGHREPAR